MDQKRFKFIDLFAGIGGFHLAMSKLGGECVFASEIDDHCINTYRVNFPETRLEGDIRDVNISSIPKFDVLCAGFPCQPFSKAGQQKGFQDETRGNLFDVIMSFLDEHKETKFIILENVRNLADKTENWGQITAALKQRNFLITEQPIILSPTSFGVPQLRERVYILGVNRDFRNEQILTNGFIHVSDLKLETTKIDSPFYARSVLEETVDEIYYLSDRENEILEAWEEFFNETDFRQHKHTVWMNYFGFNFKEDNDFYASIGFSEIPDWKKKIIRKNRELYRRNKAYIDEWAMRYRLKTENKLHQKFEWNCGNDDISFKDTIIQIRQSGIRVKRMNFFPTLVAMNNTPIVWDPVRKKYRRVTPQETAAMQSFPKSHKLIGTDNQIYKQLGNSINLVVVERIAEALFKLGRWDNHGQD